MRNSTMEYKVNQAYEELKRLIQWNPNSEEKFLQKMVCLLLPGQRKCWPEAIRDLRQSFEAEQWMKKTPLLSTNPFFALHSNVNIGFAH